ncbi:MAG: hypothetical protein ACR2P4_08390 [Gammaproteobacteria bacterium]
MLNGLEASERKLLAVVKETKEFRIDSRFFKKEYLGAKAAVEKAGAAALEDDASLSILHPAEIKRNYVSDGGVWFLRAQNLRPMHIDGSNKVFVSDEDAKTLNRNLLRKGDLLITRTGAAGSAAVFTKGTALASSHIFVVRNKMFCHYYLMAYMNCRYGRLLADRGIYGGLQPEISQTYLKGMPVYRASATLQTRIRKVVQNAYDAGEKSANLYKRAERDLLRHLGLLEWQPQESGNAVKTFRDSMGASRRLDAEYYQPKYDDIMRLIRQNPEGVVSVDAAVCVKNKNSKPADDEFYDYIELANITPAGEISDCATIKGEDMPTRARRIVAQGDVIVSSVEGSLSSIALAEERHHNAFCSTGFYVINSQVFNSETLLLLFRSVVGQMQLRRGCSGTILTAILPGAFGGIILPVIKGQKQAAIKKTITEVQHLRALSKNLLDNARQAVEIAIEKGENKALAFLQKQTTP